MSSYNSLLNKYNTLVAKCQTMQETLKTKEEQWSRKSDEFKSVEDNTRELCKLILAKDKSQINIGTESGSWGSLSTRDLIVQATQSYKKYNKDRALALQQILDIAEERQDTIDGLKAQILFYENNGTGNEQEYKEAVEQEEKEKALQTAIDNQSHEFQQNLKNNNVQVIMTDESDANGNDFILDIANELDSINTNTSSIPVQNGTNGKLDLYREKNRQKKVTKKYAAEINLGRIIENLSDIQKSYIVIIGSLGLSEQTDIINELKRIDLGKNSSEKYLANQTYTAAKELQGLGIIISEKVTIPLKGKSNCNIIRLTEMGLRLYFLMEGKKPVLAEANRIQTEHDNIHHGYGIKAIWQGIDNSGNYIRSNMDCRKDPLIVDPKKNKNITYIPDIIAVKKSDKKKCFFEYERGFSSKDTIIEKCNKMSTFTSDMYFLTDTKEHAESLLKNLIAWKKEAVKRHLKRKVYLSTATFFQSNNFDVDKSWMYILPEDSDQPIVNN